ncbi:MAG: hypothetical protein R3242_06670 [Akkermansiaceae bacterium]|nr:hypothetical protein [Akkermansiaceae bacterium]
MFPRLLIITLFLLPCLCQAEIRLWKNADASRSFRGEFIKREGDKVTVRVVNNGSVVTIPLEVLHQDDIAWLDKQAAGGGGAGGGGGAEQPPEIATGCFYDTLAFGDDRATVIKKLKASKRFHSELNETYFNRVGLNGTFETTPGNEFFGMKAAIYYEWDENNGLKNLSLYGHETAPAEAKTALIPRWNQMIRDITRYFGEPKSSSPKPMYAGLGEGEITFSHVWPMKTGGTLLMGVGKQDDKLMIIARFSREQH